MTSKIEQLLLQLDPKLLTEVQNYLEYLVFLQQKKQKPTSVRNISKKQDTLTLLHNFKGDAPFPNMDVSKSEIYEQ